MKTNEYRSEIRNSIIRAVFVAIAIVIQLIWIYGLATRFTNYYAPISTAMSILALILVMVIYARDMNSAFKLSWIILILVFPLFGVCLYILFGNESAVRFVKKRFERTNEELKSYYHQDEGTLVTLKEADRGLYNQSYFLENYCGFPVYNDSDVCFYGDTVKALEAQKSDLRKARKFIFLEYHAIEDSSSWQGIEDILIQKAKEGVEVRVLYDDVGSIGFLSKPFEKRLESENIKCHIFNTLQPFLNAFMNYRDHRKITVIDGQIGFTGGYNIADEYFNITHPYGNWKDSGIRIEGNAVKSLTLTFLEMWDTAEKTHEDPYQFLPDISYSSKEKGYIQPYSDSPLDKKRIGKNVYLNMIKQAKQSVYIVTPYLILDDETRDELIQAATRGVDVRIVTPGIPDKKIVYAVTHSYYEALVNAGVRIYEYTPGFNHSKQVVCDDEIAAVGTINLDFRSLYLHFENGCLFYNCQAVHEVSKDFEETFQVSKNVSEDYQVKPSLILRILRCILRLFSPLL